MNSEIAIESAPVQASPVAAETPAASACFVCGISDEIAILTFDCPDSSANVLNRVNLLELKDHLEKLTNTSKLRGLILTSAKPSIFIAGADLRQMREADPDEVAALIELGQKVFSQLANLPFPTIAAIHGACAGGGYELALACRMRIASDDPKTKIGLPETGLGLIPAWGGSTRLPRLIGLDPAAAVILSGKLLPAAAALRKGMIDRVVASEHLLDQARAMIASPVRHQPALRQRLLCLPGLRHAFLALAMRSLRRRTGGHYAAPEKALEVMANAVSVPVEQAFQLERQTFVALTRRPDSRHLTGLFFKRERSKKWRPASGQAATIESAAVIGAGVMGAGIAYWLASRSLRVLLQDINPDALARALHGIRQRFDKAVARRIMNATDARNAFDRITVSCEDVPLDRFDCIIEAAPEDMALKQSLYRRLARRAAPAALWCSNTSALPIAELASAAPDPSRFIGLHFFNPVERMPLVEIIPAEGTSGDSIATAARFVQALGKLPVVVRDRPGFLVNRVLMPYLLEAVRLVDQGHPPQVIDHAMLKFGMPMGPLRLLDEVGLDVALHVGEHMAKALPHIGEPPVLLGEMVERGLLGRKSGEGFYDHRAPGFVRRLFGRFGLGESALRPSAKAALLPGGRCQRAPVATADLANHLADRLTTEAQRCLKEGVVEDADQLDFAMVAGTGYPPFRGGPIAHGRHPITPETAP